jgi:hypothetical protein
MKAEVAARSSRVNLQLAKINFAALGKVVSQLHLCLSADVLTTVTDPRRFGGSLIEVHEHSSARICRALPQAGSRLFP